MGWITTDWFYSWAATAWNRWGEEVEQYHPAKGYRHRTFDNNLKTLPWEFGPHPIAKELRDSGKEKTENFDR